ACTACDHRTDILHGLNDPGPQFCPSCGKEGTMRKLFAPPTIHFKGSGWAKKDRGGSAGSRSSSAAKGDGGSSSESGSSSGSGSSDGRAGSDSASKSPSESRGSGDSRSGGSNTSGESGRS